MTLTGCEAHFIAGAAGRMFSILHVPDAGAGAKGAIVYLHPVADELNKSRRMAALAARALAASGWWVLQPDLNGCGDSEGDFENAGWDTWIEDASCAIRWLQRRSGHTPLLWGLRAGCLVASAVARQMDDALPMIFWHPAPSGRLHLQQWLRMKVAGEMLADGRKASDGTRQLREQLLAGTAVEVGGYMISPAVGKGLDGAGLAPPPRPAKLAWLEISSSQPGELLPASKTAVQAWEVAGWQVDAGVIAGPPFWQTLEIEELPDLILETVARAEGLRN